MVCSVWPIFGAMRRIPRQGTLPHPSRSVNACLQDLLLGHMLVDVDPWPEETCCTHASQAAAGSTLLFVAHSVCPTDHNNIDKLSLGGSITPDPWCRRFCFARRNSGLTLVLPGCRKVRSQIPGMSVICTHAMTCPCRGAHIERCSGDDSDEKVSEHRVRPVSSVRITHVLALHSRGCTNLGPAILHGLRSVPCVFAALSSPMESWKFSERVHQWKRVEQATEGMSNQPPSAMDRPLPSSA